MVCVILVVVVVVVVVLAQGSLQSVVNMSSMAAVHQWIEVVVGVANCPGA